MSVTAAASPQMVADTLLPEAIEVVLELWAMAPRAKAAVETTAERILKGGGEGRSDKMKERVCWPL